MYPEETIECLFCALETGGGEETRLFSMHRDLLGLPGSGLHHERMAGGGAQCGGGGWALSLGLCFGESIDFRV